MINAVGVVGWGVGGIEAEAAMLGQPVYFLTPDVVGVELVGRLREGVTATDLVLTVTELLRRQKVVGTFVEYFGEGASTLTVTDRATLANMAPEYGATMGFFPVDQKTVSYLRTTGRSEADCELFEAYFRAQGLFGIPRAGQIDYSRSVRLDLASIVPSLAGPKRPQDRIALPDMASKFNALFSAPEADDGFARPPETLTQRYPTERPGVALGNGDVLIAAITSCTNTSNPAVMIAAGLLARKAVARGLQVQPHIKTSLAPGSRVVTDYLEKAELLAPLAELGFALAGYGCTTCIGNAGDLDPAFNKAIAENQLVVAAVLSGNRNFEARIHPNLRANYLASPPLVVAFAIAGRVNIDLDSEALGIGADGQPVFLRDVWPTSEEIDARAALGARSGNLPPSLRRRQRRPGSVECHSRHVAARSTTGRHRATSRARRSSNCRPAGGRYHRRTRAAAARRLGDHRSYFAGRLFRRGDAGGQLAQGPGRRARRLQFLWRTPRAPRSDDARHLCQRPHSQPDAAGRRRGRRPEGGYTLLDGQQTTVFAAAMAYLERGTPSIVVAGEEYGTGSSRDWAAKGTRLLGVRAVIARSFERIHRANLVGMGVLPVLQFMADDSATAHAAAARRRELRDPGSGPGSDAHAEPHPGHRTRADGERSGAPTAVPHRYADRGSVLLVGRHPALCVLGRSNYGCERLVSARRS
jgi:aconitate hydratase